MNAKLAKTCFKQGKYVRFFKEGYYIGKIVNITETKPLTCTVETLSIETYPCQYYIQGNKDVLKESKPYKYKEQIDFQPRNLSIYEGEIIDYDISLEQALKTALVNEMSRENSISQGATGFNFEYAREALEIIRRHCEKFLCKSNNKGLEI